MPGSRPMSTTRPRKPSLRRVAAALPPARPPPMITIGLPPFRGDITRILPTRRLGSCEEPEEPTAVIAPLTRKRKSLTQVALEELPEAVDRRAAQHDLEHDAGDTDDERDDHDDEVLEQHPERQQHDTERRQGVESRERRSQEGASGPADHEQPKDDVAQTMVEQEAQVRVGEALEPPDHLQECSDEALPLLARQLELAPALGQPDLVAAGYQLKREQYSDDLEHMRDAASR